MPKFDELLKNYTLGNSGKITNFIKEHEGIIDYITEITPLLNDYFPNYQKTIEFCEDNESSDLDFLMIYIKGCDFDEDYQVLSRFKNEPIYKSKFSKDINGLVCVELW